MKHFNSALRIAGISGMVFALVACENTQTPDASGVAPESKGGAVFSEKFGDAGQFTIEKNPEGVYNYSVGATIGSEAEKAVMSSMDMPTLAGVYQHIHGGKTEIPALVDEASRWFESRASSGAEKRISNPAPLQKEATESDFRSSVCRNFNDGNYVWKPQSCWWKSNANYMGTSGVNSYSDANDRVWFWNKTRWTGTTQLHTPVNTWKPTVPPGGVMWVQWGGTYSNVSASIKLDGVQGGEVGVSNSSRFFRF